MVDDRFVLEHPAGIGGMGEIFRATDQRSGEPVALKVLLHGHAPERIRFEREAQVLAELHHPAIVRYVAHGVTRSGEPYLVMEWLDGEDLARRLQRSRLSIGESLTFGVRTAQALGAAHAHGIIHRDLKPSNLFLVRGQTEQVKVLDFGIARLGDRTQLTQTGTALGTPGYMAPEQARGERMLTSQVDVFALGCVLFECLTGSPAFAGDHIMAVLAKILFAESPRLHERLPEVPSDLDALVARMLAKKPEERPRDGAVVAAALAALGGAPSETRKEPEPSVSLSLTGGERQTLSVVLLGRERSLDGPTPSSSEMPARISLVSRGRSRDVATKQALDVALPLAAQELRRTVAAYGGQLEVLADGSVIATITGARVATDQAALAARCALALRTLSPGRPMALATGQGEVGGKLPVGDAIDRAASMLSARARALPQAGELAPIAIDEVTGGLLDGRFDVREGDHELELHAEHELAGCTRTLLGRPTTCVGRERELSALEGVFSECVDESVAHAVLITAPAGIGKSRLAHEFTRMVRQWGRPVEIWSCRGDPLRAGSAFGLLGQVLRNACDIRDGELLAVRQDKLRERVARHVPAADRRRVTEFLGEVVGASLPDAESAPLRAARQDAQLMAEQLRRAWEDFMKAETSAQPVLLVLEDLHWGDMLTVRFVDLALRSLSGRPFMVLGLARPEVHELFPRLWKERDVQEVRLRGLTRKASERLVRQVLGDEVSSDTLESLVKQADGHAFYLEELIRAVAERKGEVLPQTIIAMVQARLKGLESEARRVLRAASIYGEAFCKPYVFRREDQGSTRLSHRNIWVFLGHREGRIPGRSGPGGQFWIGAGRARGDVGEGGPRELAHGRGGTRGARRTGGPRELAHGRGGIRGARRTGGPRELAHGRGSARRSPRGARARPT
ncbi:serine/threonine-protein kinase [Polyangium aurulentum]|uniref:serine/threonine-protein kinase n=1 Tax=Polyangium aurulentum TaxID=2567896 RepID=UPI00200BD9CF|nr:serine/threonine-protein kinase [Polyangium aurulentum]